MNVLNDHKIEVDQIMKHYVITFVQTLDTTEEDWDAFKSTMDALTFGQADQNVDQVVKDLKSTQQLYREFHQHEHIASLFKRPQLPMRSMDVMTDLQEEPTKATPLFIDRDIKNRVLEQYFMRPVSHPGKAPVLSHIEYLQTRDKASKKKRYRDSCLVREKTLAKELC